MMLTKARELDVANDNDLIVFLSEHFFQMKARILVETTKDLAIHPRDSIGRLNQAFTIWVFTYGDQNLSNRPAKALVVYCGRPEVRIALHRSLVSIGLGMAIDSGMTNTD